MAKLGSRLEDDKRMVLIVAMAMEGMLIMMMTTVVMELDERCENEKPGRE